MATNNASTLTGTQGSPDGSALRPAPTFYFATAGFVGMLPPLLSVFFLLLPVLPAQAGTVNLLAQTESSHLACERTSGRIEAAPGLRAFDAWLDRYLAASGPNAKTSLLPEGVALARERRVALAALIKTDPAQALALTIPASIRRQVPAAIAKELENRVSGIGDFVVMAVDPIKNGVPVEPIRRFVRLGGRTYEAHAYGRRLGATTKYGIPMHGVAVGAVLALHPSALRELEAGELPHSTQPPITPPTAAQIAVAGSTPVPAELDGKVYRFASRERLQAAEARFEAAEAGIGPWPIRPITTLVETLAPPARTGLAADTPVEPLSWTEGDKNVLIIRVDFPDLAGDPKGRDGTVYSAAYVQNLADTQISPCYRQSSYGLTSLSSTVTTQLYRLPRPAAYYATNNLVDQLHADAETAAAADYPLTNYDRLVVLFSPLEGISGSEVQYGGLANIGGQKIWLNGECDFRSLAHELGHTFGLDHANLWQVTDGNPVSPGGADVDAGDPFDTMGANYANDPRTDFNPWFKYLLGWIPGSQVQTVTNTGLYRISRFDNSAGTGILALKVPGDRQRSLWIGVRRKFTTNASMQHGAYVIWGYNGDRPSSLLDMTTPGNNAGDAALAIDTTFIDRHADDVVGIQPVAEGGVAPNEYLDVQITFLLLITTPPGDQAVMWGQNAAFTVAAAGNPTPAYQWQQQGAGATNWTNLVEDGTYSGTTTATLTVSNAITAMNGARFQCIVSNPYGNLTSAPPALLSVNGTRPGITMEPENQTVISGQSAVFSVGAIGTPPLTYQWQRLPAGGSAWSNLTNNATFQGVLTSQLTVVSTTPMAGDQFRCVVSNPYGSAISVPSAALFFATGVRLALTTLTGQAGAAGVTDGTGANARFNTPFGVATDNSGNVYVADTYNHTIRRITPAGVVSTVAGQAGNPGSADSTGTNASFNTPCGVAIDSAGNLYIADAGNDTIRQITPTGVVTTLVGQAGRPGSSDGAGTNASFNTPCGVAVDGAGNVYVTDTYNHTIRQITPTGVVSTLAGLAGVPGSNDGRGAGARFYAPFGVAVDSAGNVYVADTGNNLVREIAPAGTVRTRAGQAGSNARFNGPFGVAVDRNGNVYVADTYDQTIQQITPGGAVTILAGQTGSSGSLDGLGNTARLYDPSGVAVDSIGNVYVADSVNSTIRSGQLVWLAPPLLGITASGSQVVLAWPALATGFVLESADTLGLVVAWNPMTNGAARSDDQLLLTNDVTQAGRFYRLHRP